VDRVVLRIIIQNDLSQVDRSLTTHDLPGPCGIEDTKVTGTLNSSCFNIVTHQAALVGAYRTVSNDITVWAYATRDPFTYFEKYTGRRFIRIVELGWFAFLEALSLCNNFCRIR
jgi:hypothetical protein